jgi:hypothetical protein
MGPVRVLVVDAGFAVGAAVEQRIRDVATVERSDGHDLVTGERDGRGFDLVVLSPYVPPGIRAQIVDRLRATGAPPSLAVLEDLIAGPRVELVNGAPVTNPAVAAVLDRLRRGP